MTTTTKARRYLESLHDDAGWALKECASSQRLISQIVGDSESWVSRQANGHPGGPVQRFYDHVHALASHRKGDPAPLLVEGVRVMREALIEWPDADLVDLITEILDREIDAQAAEDRATLGLRYRIATDEAGLMDDEIDEAIRAVTVEMSAELTLVVALREYKRRRADR